MTAAAASTLSTRCADGEHNRCPGLLPGSFCGCHCGHPATVNVRAAGAVVLHDRAHFDNDRMFHAEAREMLAMLGLVDGREIVADDVRANTLGGAHQATGGTTAERPLRSVDGDLDDDDIASARPLTTPPGLRVLPPPAASPAPKPAACREAKNAYRRGRYAANRDDTAAEKKRLVSAGVNPGTASVLARELAPIKHGTLGGYVAHSQRKQPIPEDDPCGCRAVGTAYFRARRAARKAAAAVVAPPPKPVSAAELLAEAQRSPHRSVARAAATGIRLLVQIQTAPPNRVNRLTAQLADALADVSRAQARAASRTNGHR